MIRIENAGGALVKRGFKFGTRFLPAGTNLTAAEIASIPQSNRNALIDKHFLEVYPVPAGTQRHVVQVSRDGFNVIEGVKLNIDPLSKEQAIALAGSTLATEIDTVSGASAGDRPAAPSPKQTRAKSRKAPKARTQ